MKLIEKSEGYPYRFRDLVIWVFYKVPDTRLIIVESCLLTSPIKLELSTLVSISIDPENGDASSLFTIFFNLSTKGLVESHVEGQGSSNFIELGMFVNVLWT